MSVEILDGATIVNFMEDEEAFNVQICDRFAHLDSDHDGRLSYGEMLKELQCLRVLETHFGVDVETDPDELVRVYDSLFVQFDHDLNGTVDLEEFKSETKQMMLAMANGMGFLPVQMVLEEDSFLKKAAEWESAKLKMSVEILDGATIVNFMEDEEAFNVQIRDRFAHLDTDHDGRLSYGEMLKELQCLRVLETHFGVDVETDPDELVRVYDSLFVQFDHDLNGTVDLEEFKSETKQMMLAMANGMGFLPVQMVLEEDSFLKKAAEWESAKLFPGEEDASLTSEEQRWSHALLHHIGYCHSGHDHLAIVNIAKG
ncbi:hypothetical protein SADUNF_Sadunf02G0177700 [Salix dunnii]|uniref:EF-hand domain-containing protein n=1 Tax=Salix dunnii TaxID=1413687 RepID=A0A835N8L7_9ROSI|nr:hypothetical protein SADUNF_Sadunf02G0177700 [Salix dunnii]